MFLYKKIQKQEIDLSKFIYFKVFFITNLENL